MQKSAYHFNETDNICKVLVETASIDPFEVIESTTISIYINGTYSLLTLCIHTHMHVEEEMSKDLFAGLMSPFNETNGQMLPFVAVLPNGDECQVKKIPKASVGMYTDMAYNHVDRHLYSCFGFDINSDEFKGTLLQRTILALISILQMVAFI